MSTKPNTNTPDGLFGSFNYGFRASPSAVVLDLVSRVENESNHGIKVALAQRTIGAMLAFVSTHGGLPIREYSATFHKLASLTGLTVDALAGGDL